MNAPLKITQTIRVMSPVDALRTAVVLALEGLCFISADGFAERAPTSEDTIDATVEFRGPGRGAVTITMPRAFLPTLVESFMPDAVLDLRAQSDLVLELANIVCGNVVPRVYGRAAVYDLSPPRLERDLREATATAVILVAGGWVEATVHGEDS